MTRHHYTPATMLGRFSTETTSPSRARTLWVRRRGQAEAFKTNAGKLGYVHDLYALLGRPDEARSAVDDVWNGYERRLGDALSRLASCHAIDADLWLRVLVPFVAGMFVRVPEFNAPFFDDLRELLKDNSEWDAAWHSNNQNTGRLDQLQLLLAPAIAAAWTVMHSSDTEPLITSDLGFTALVTPDWKSTALVVPIALDSILCVAPAPRGLAQEVLIEANPGRWVKPIFHLQMDAGDSLGCREAMARFAREFIAGPTERSVNELAHVLNQPDRVRRPVDEQFAADLWPSFRLQIAHDREWHRLVSAIRNPAANPRCGQFAIDWEAVEQGWHPTPLFIPMGYPEFVSGLTLHDRTISLQLTEVPGYTDVGRRTPPPWGPLGRKSLRYRFAVAKAAIKARVRKRRRAKRKSNGLS